MAPCREPREAFIQHIGIFVASLTSSGINASNNEFNGRRIDQYRCSKFLKDEMIIHRFYLYETLIHHNFVVFQTDSGHTFKVHLIADSEPGYYIPIYVVIGPTYWKPTDKYVRRCNKKARDLKRFVKHEGQIFGTYEVGLHDCRHFARVVAAFLTS